MEHGAPFRAVWSMDRITRIDGRVIGRRRREFTRSLIYYSPVCNTGESILS
jgi:hypothetical protein